MAPSVDGVDDVALRMQIEEAQRLLLTSPDEDVRLSAQMVLEECLAIREQARLLAVHADHRYAERLAAKFDELSDSDDNETLDDEPGRDGSPCADCLICLEPCLSAFPMECDHIFCMVCARRYCLVALEEAATKIPLLCPMPQCAKVISPEHTSQVALLDNSSQEKFERSLRTSAMDWFTISFPLQIRHHGRHG